MNCSIRKTNKTIQYILRPNEYSETPPSAPDFSTQFTRSCCCVNSPSIHIRCTQIYAQWLAVLCVSGRACLHFGNVLRMSCPDNAETSSRSSSLVQPNAVRPPSDMLTQTTVTHTHSMLRMSDTVHIFTQCTNYLHRLFTSEPTSNAR